MITYHRAKTNEELQEILELQKQNLRHLITEEQKQKEGFVTLQHDFEILKKMNDACAHCIAKQDQKVVGYALSMLQEFKNQIPLLVPMFEEIDEVIKNQNLSSNYIAMGQICVDKNVRGQGAFRGLYKFMAEELKHDFDTIITEVDTKNIRSSQAHQAVGFKVIKNYTSNDQLWEVISLEI
ncbi:GNAT family N-acetyltransferase [Olleya marilimosa]|uniref:GNAT family N-acetyltransferase n=1 Tax=Olleya marilimosa TaxID=272164 RepID=UPI000C151331|nr:GNAT family N-acetyltransferase [Olleya marilimosa]MBD3890402.1 GNAT family N-acetyltransferase [Olleya marilimosa]PIB33066.1 GNAT family N-acetyltransferase [Gaetbulibacter sp. 5U11]|tara:strand:- start:337231 stop:337773 length:543 start_codon:yes stop_codon:yes gene_type:complete